MITPMKAFVNHFYRKAGLINDEKTHFCRFTPTEIFMTLLTFTVFCAALFLNGATDAANAVTGAISSKAMSARSAVCLAALLEGVGLAAAYIFLPAVSNTVSSLCDLGRTTTQSSAVICTVCLSSVALWAALASTPSADISPTLWPSTWSRPLSLRCASSAVSRSCVCESSATLLGVPTTTPASMTTSGTKLHRKHLK